MSFRIGIGTMGWASGMILFAGLVYLMAKGTIPLASVSKAFNEGTQFWLFIIVIIVVAIMLTVVFGLIHRGKYL